MVTWNQPLPPAGVVAGALGHVDAHNKLRAALDELRTYLDDLPTGGTDGGFSGAYADLTGAPDLALVATSGSYADLQDKPSIPSAVTWTSLAGKPAVIAAGADAAAARTAIGAGTSSFSGVYSDLSGKPTIPSVPSGSVVAIFWDGTSWNYGGEAVTARPAELADDTINFIDAIGTAVPPGWAIVNDIFDQVIV